MKKFNQIKYVLNEIFIAILIFILYFISYINEFSFELITKNNIFQYKKVCKISFLISYNFYPN